MLLIASVLQGVAGSLIFSEVLAFIQVLFDAKDRGAALCAYGTTIGPGTVLGLVAGGALIQAHLVSDPWRPTLLVSVPIGVAAFTVAVFSLPN